MSSYRAFLESKIKLAEASGIEIDAGAINPILKPHQSDIVRWCVRGGRRAIFASFGLGKSVMQIETLRLVLEHASGRGLIVAPLGVRQEFLRDAEMLGVPLRFIRSIEEADETGLHLTNYETVRDGKLDPAHFTAASLDEASILRGFGGTKTFREFMATFAGDARDGRAGSEVRYRFVATATPSPNEYIELLSYAAYLGVMDVGQAKTRFFQRNSEKNDDLTLYPHKVREFWLWVSSWAVFLQKPSDLCRCSCHAERTSAANASDALSSDHGRPPQNVTAHGCVSATAEAPTSPLQTTSRRAESSAADACGQSTGARGPSSTSFGAQCSADAPAHPTRTGPTMAGGALPCASDGGISSTSEPTWASRPRAEQSSGSITTETTSRETAAGQPAPSKQETGDLDEKKPAPVASDCCKICRCNEGYALPPLTVRWHEVPSDHSTAGADKSGQTRLFRNAAVSLSDAAREKRDSLPARMAKLEEIVGGDPDAHWLLWHDLERERLAIEKAIPGAITVWGSQDFEEREQAIADFSAGKIKILATKPVIAGSGCNFQRHCHRAVFMGVGYKFNDFIQACHRIHRFLQAQPVQIDIVYSEAEREIRARLEEKWARHDEQAAIMAALIREHGLATNALADGLIRTIGCERREVAGDGYTLVNNDCVDETARMDADSVDLIVTSIPFEGMYEYSPSYNDFGHTDTSAEFWAQMDFLIPEMLRVLKPGRVCAIHVKDRIVPGGINGFGFQSVAPISDYCTANFTKHGFAFLARKTVVTDVVRENNQTYRLGWSEQCKDGSRMGAGLPEYIMLFRKPPTDRSSGYADDPVAKAKPLSLDRHGNVVPYAQGEAMIPGTGYSRSRWQIDAHGFMRSNGDRLLAPADLVGLAADVVWKLWKQHSLGEVYDFDHHVACCEAREAKKELPKTFFLLPPHSWHPDVWSDITRMRTLNTVQYAKGRELHVCPLPIDLVDRLIVQLSQAGELVFDPFGGIGTVPYRAIKLKRRGLAVELNGDYFRDAILHCETAARAVATPSLFDLIEAEAGHALEVAV